MSGITSLNSLKKQFFGDPTTGTESPVQIKHQRILKLFSLMKTLSIKNIKFKPNYALVCVVY